MMYLKLLETFVLRVLMDKNEYNFFHKNFRPVKLIVILVLVANVGFSVFLLNRLYRVHEVVTLHCPAVYEIKTTTTIVVKEKK